MLGRPLIESHWYLKEGAVIIRNLEVAYFRECGLRLYRLRTIKVKVSRVWHVGINRGLAGLRNNDEVVSY